jgi:hypothetical protein
VSGRPVAIALVIALWLAPAARADPITVVHPTGAHPHDAALVQAAVDAGGTVLLKAVGEDGSPTPFNFGPAEPGSGHVTLTRDVRVLGEEGDRARTIIQGGHAPIRSFDGISAEVRGVAFEGPLRFALFFNGPHTAETRIVSNRVTGLVGQVFPSGALRRRGAGRQRWPHRYQ